MIPESEWTFFEATEQRIRHLERHRTENDLALHRGEAPGWDPAELDARRAEIVQEMDYPARVEQALAQAPPVDQARRLEHHRGWILRAVFETHPEIAPYLHELKVRHLAFRPEVNGRPATRAELSRILAHEPDPGLREAAWKALTPLAESLAGDLTELFRRRQALARAVLDSGYAPVAFHLHQEDRPEVVALVDGIERYTRKPYGEILRDVARALGRQEVEAWDLDYGLRRLGAAGAGNAGAGAFPPGPSPGPGVNPLPTALDQARRWGLLPAGLAAREADFPFASRVFAGAAPHDVSLLWRPAGGLEGFRTAFAGVGRSLPALHAGPREFPLSQPPAVTEASAELLAAITRDPAWLAETTGAGAREIDRRIEVERALRIVRLRRLAAGVAFENLVYAQSDLDPHRLHADVREQMLQETRRPDVRWPLDPTLVVDPLTRASEILGALIAAQLGERMRELHPEPRKAPEAGAWIRESLFLSDLPWSERVERATGRPLGFDAFAREAGVSFEGPDLAETEEISDEAAEEYFKDIDLSDLDLD